MPDLLELSGRPHPGDPVVVYRGRERGVGRVERIERHGLARVAVVSVAAAPGSSWTGRSSVLVPTAAMVEFAVGWEAII